MRKFKGEGISLLTATTAVIICGTIFATTLAIHREVTRVDQITITTAITKPVLANIPTAPPQEERIPASQISRGGDIERSQANTIRAINAKLAGKLENTGEIFLKYAQESNVNSKLLAAICIIETANGSSRVLRDHNNVAGINWNAYVQIKDEQGRVKRIRNPYKKAGWYNHYPSVEESIKDMAQRLKWWYIDQGRLDPYAIGRKWAPISDPRNGIGGMNNSAWPKNVTAIYNEICELENKEVQ